MSAARAVCARGSAGARNPYLLVGALFVSTIGDWLFRLALPLLVLTMTGSVLGAAFTYALEYAPYIVFSLFGGVIADRFDRSRLLMISDACSAGIVGIITTLIFFDVQQVVLIYLGAFALASVRPIYHPAVQSIVPNLVPDEQLSKINAQLQTVESLLGLAGPVIGGVVIAALGITAALSLDTASFVLSLIIIGLIRVANTHNDRPTSKLRTDFREGVAYILRDRVTLWASVLMAGTNAGLFLIEANLIFFIVWLRDLPVEAVGIVFGAQGAGCIVGALLAPWLGRRARPGHIIVASMFGAGSMTCCLLLPFGLAGLAFAWGAEGIFTMLIVVTWFTLRQRIVPPALLGRIVSLSRMMSYATIPLASVGGGALLAMSDSAAPLVAASVLVQITVGAVAWLTPLRSADIPAALKPRPRVVPAALTEVAADSKQ